MELLTIRNWWAMHEWVIHEQCLDLIRPLSNSLEVVVTVSQMLCLTTFCTICAECYWNRQLYAKVVLITCRLLSVLITWMILHIPRRPIIDRVLIWRMGECAYAMEWYGCGYLRPLFMFGTRMGICNDGSIDTCTNGHICLVSFKWNLRP